MIETLCPPYLLLATPALLDPNFARTVVLMGHHAAEGAMGWVLNRVHDSPACELLVPAHREGVNGDTPLHIGGPVATEGLFAVFRHALDGVESVEMAPGLHLSSSPAVLPLLFGRAPGRMLVEARLVFGYAGWGAGQLEREMEQGVWLALPYEIDLAFSTGVEDLWMRCFDRLGLNPAMLTTPSGRKH
jgi:putative transcriptional regulator